MLRVVLLFLERGSDDELKCDVRDIAGLLRDYTNKLFGALSFGLYPFCAPIICQNKKENTKQREKNQHLVREN